jgi:enterochelin esterase-like enzyme
MRGWAAFVDQAIVPGSVRSTTESMRATASVAVVGVLVAAVVLTVGFPGAKADLPESPAYGMLPPSFRQIDQGPAGGTLWQGVIPNREVPEARRLAVVYLPPNVSPMIRYPVLYLLHGFRGSPYAYSAGLHLATAADSAIETHAVRPFIAVAPPAGVTKRFDGEWSGVWERYVVRDVISWVESHLPVARTRASRVIAGLSAGGYGAIDIGLRHPELFQTLESWSGYFGPVHDGSLAGADADQIATHEPSLLVAEESRELHALGTRFFLSSGTTHDRWSAGQAAGFARELASLRLPYELVLKPGGHNGAFWRAQLGSALRFALAPPARSRTLLHQPIGREARAG